MTKPLTRKEFNLLTTLAPCDASLSQRELARRSGFSLGTANKLLAALTQSGLVADNQITESDKTIIGNALPDFYGGINNTFSWKDFDLSIFFTYSYGAEVLNATKLTNTKTALTNKNVLSVADDAHRWVTINASGELITNPEELAAVNQGKTVAHFGDNGSNNTYIHSWAIEDASYLKLSNITLGYTFPKKVINKIGLTKLRLYATGNNLFTWTPYTGFDPEVSTMSSALTPGVDFGAYPRSRSFVFGVNVAF